jgi:uracil phosphoribosyltransferase
MHIINFSETPSIISQYMAELRDVNIQKDRMRFRENIKRISMCMAYEISKTLGYKSTEVQTPLALSNAEVLKEQPVIALVLRAGLAMHAGFVEVFDGADNCFISAYRDEGSAEEIHVHIDYLASPNLEGRTVILVDPMLATGSSLVGGYAALLKNGKPKKMHVACIVAAPEGIAELQNKMSEIDTLWIAAIDSHLNEHAYIVPGLGDAGDLAFGEKM